MTRKNPSHGKTHLKGARPLDNRIPRDKDIPGTRWIMGMHAITAVLESDPERFKRVLVARGHRRGEQLADRLRQEGLEPRTVEEDEITRAVQSDSHQAVAALVTDNGPLPLEAVVEQEEGKTRSLLVLLDGITDPHNLGAIFRAAECLGAAAIVVGKRNGAPLSAAASKAASGATELLPRVEATNLVRTVEYLKSQNYWVVAASCSEDSTPLPKTPMPDRTALVLGAEGEGLHQLLEKSCDIRVTIPLFGQTESLNVSQAAAILLYSWAATNGTSIAKV